LEILVSKLPLYQAAVLQPKQQLLYLFLTAAFSIFALPVLESKLSSGFCTAWKSISLLPLTLNKTRNFGRLICCWSLPGRWNDQGRRRDSGTCRMLLYLYYISHVIQSTTVTWPNLEMKAIANRCWHAKVQRKKHIV